MPRRTLPVVEAAVDAVSPAAQAKNIELSVSADSEANLVYADPTRLQQVIWNLLTNAIKFTPKDGRVEVRLERINSNMRIKVSDNGLGDDLPAVALTAYASEADRARALAAGFQAHLSKPIELSALISTVAELARGRTTSQADSPD